MNLNVGIFILLFFDWSVDYERVFFVVCMPPKKFMSSSKISDLWKDAPPQPPPEKKRKTSSSSGVVDANDLDARVTTEQVRKLVERGAKSERSALAQELADVKRLKGTNQAKKLNYAELIKKQK